MKIWTAQKPANLALIKYMGKTEEQINQATNISLSFALDRFVSTVELEVACGEQADRWLPMTMGIDQPSPLMLSTTEQQRFLSHLAALKQHWGYTGAFWVRSGNNFPSNCGLASSASCFAALTDAAVEALSSLRPNQHPAYTTSQRAALSQKGSGSSCRSFFSPWCVWEPTVGASAITLPYRRLLHYVVVVSTQPKRVSSSEAHNRVRTSPQFKTRPARAHARCTALITALRKQDWSLAYRISWDEFQDMHTLFSTAIPAFSYLSRSSLDILEYLRNYWAERGDGPLVSVDAGPNIHLLFRTDQQAMAHDLTIALSKYGDIL